MNLTTAELLKKEVHETLVAQHNLSPQEYEKIRALIARAPNLVELGIFSAMWSEHCAYKHSRFYLKDFPFEKQDKSSPHQILVKAGEENAGVVDLGKGEALCFKIESHNHPTAVEPFEGAATGIGGILRDIFTMGARPLIFGNSLRFGELSHPKSRRLFTEAVAGIAHYGNCVGLPNLGGDVAFDKSYQGNPLVNAFCLGMLSHKAIRRGHARGVGNLLYYVGAPTGRDGLGGASFASQNLSEASEKNRPAVQKGDPFLGKLLMEACLEMMEQDTGVVGIQDMGAAGLTCAIFETAARGQTGMRVNLDKVPLRAKGMNAYEILLSESQERMLVIVEKGRESALEAVFKKWELPAVAIGEVSEGHRVRIFHEGHEVACLNAEDLAQGAPLYQPQASEPEQLAKARAFNWKSLGRITAESLTEALYTLMGTPSLASKEWIFSQYDHTVKGQTAHGPQYSDAGLFRLKLEGDSRLVALTHDGLGRYCYLDPKEGAKCAMAEAVRNLVCVGATPLAMTNNLNFANPQVPEMFWYFKEAVAGLAEACRFFDIPVIGGNVSFYNETAQGPIDPTPIVAVCGLLEDLAHAVPATLTEGREALILLGDFPHELGASAWLWHLHGLKAGQVPQARLKEHGQLRDFMLRERALMKACHDVSEGGLLFTLSEMLFGEKTLGACLKLEGPLPSLPELLFGESQGRIVVATEVDKAEAFLNKARAHGLVARVLGVASDRGQLSLQVPELPTPLTWNVHTLRKLYEEALEKALKTP